MRNFVRGGALGATGGRSGPPVASLDSSFTEEHWRLKAAACGTGADRRSHA
jgi:hypothetical protein